MTALEDSPSPEEGRRSSPPAPPATTKATESQRRWRSGGSGDGTARRVPGAIAVVLLSLWAVTGVPVSASDPEELITPPGATDVRSKDVGSTRQLYCNLDVPYPASSIIDFLNQELAARGWAPMEMGFLNPDIPTSHVRGWATFDDATGDAVKVVHQWWGDWSNADGAVITYVLRYAYPESGESDLEGLTLVGVYTPPERAELIKALLPYEEADVEVQRREDRREEDKRIAEIRRKSTHVGRVTVRVVEEPGPLQSPFRDADLGTPPLEFDESVPPLVLGVAAAGVDGADGVGGPALELIFTVDSANRLEEFSERHLRRRIALLVRGAVVTTAVLVGPIGDSAVIHGTFSVEEAERIADTIMGE